MPQNAEEIRSFIAIELPDDVRKGLAQLRKELKRDEHRFVKWVDSDGIHLTLKFLGNIPPRLVSEITGAMEAAARGIAPFVIEISGLGAFPRLEQVRVVWVGVSDEAHRLKDLQHGIDAELATLGFAREERPFVPHLTLARVRQGASPSERRSLGELLRAAVFEDKYSVRVEAISLMRSQLTPAGAIYTRLSEVQLSNRS
ncbi:MAG: RNA 2',3'-cyclic phosphodiesterase [Dehalococcoidia bacterium]